MVSVPGGNIDRDYFWLRPKIAIAKNVGRFKFDGSIRVAILCIIQILVDSAKYYFPPNFLVA